MNKIRSPPIASYSALPRAQSAWLSRTTSRNVQDRTTSPNVLLDNERFDMPLKPLQLLFSETFSNALFIILIIFSIPETTNKILVSGDCNFF